MEFTLAQILNKSDYWIQSILYSNNVVITDDPTENLYNSMYLIKESGLLTVEDYELFVNTEF